MNGEGSGELGFFSPMNGEVWRALLLVDEFAQHQRQDAAVVHVSDLRFVVDPRAGGEAHSRSVVGGSPDLNLLTRLQRVQAVDRVALLPEIGRASCRERV